MHDSEDVLHPLELKFFNYLLPRKDMIQLPVASLEREWFELVAGTYMDEFAEWHAKDLVVRESLAGTVPSAGVGTCFSRRAILALIEETRASRSIPKASPKTTTSARAPASSACSRSSGAFRCSSRMRRRSASASVRSARSRITMPLCVREFFPDTFRTAYRQRARWTLGIGLQGWKQTGWSGSLANRYLLLRDRKGVVTSFVSMLAYVLSCSSCCCIRSRWRRAVDLTPGRTCFRRRSSIPAGCMRCSCANFVALLRLRVLQRVSSRRVCMAGSMA